MRNIDIYQKDPSKNKLVNDGVASLNDNKENVLRYELETFVCDGRYEEGIEHILRTYLANLGQAQQPGVWVSGFYGSGKSHLVKMLSLLWSNKPFSDGATPRGITDLPPSVSDLLKELSTAEKRHGYLHSASGTLKANDDSNSVRSALLALIFKSVDLPSKYHLASFVLWLKEEGIFEDIKKKVSAEGKDWDKEVLKLHVSQTMRKALVALKPETFYNEKTCNDILLNQFPSGKDVSSEDMIKVVKAALTVDGKFPLTLVVLDEVQQYIGEDASRSDDVREVVEACCKGFGSKLLFIGTGQTAVTGTANLKKQEGRFTIRIELSDADVDKVIRKVVLAKKPAALSEIKKVIEKNIGEISKHLGNTSLRHNNDDTEFFVQDYPILPVRRRFWENTLRVLDQTGTESQLRNQLSMTHKTIQTNLDKDIGNVVPADYLYFDIAEKLLQARILPRKVYEQIMKWRHGSENEVLMARACSLVFLINKLSSSNKEVGIKATVDTISDLLVEDLDKGSSKLRERLPDLMSKCDLLIKVADEYRIQTEESAAWNDEFLKQRGELLSDGGHRVDAERCDRLKAGFSDQLKKKALLQGNSKVPRELQVTFDSKLPNDKDTKLYVWVRDGWSTDENSVRIEAKEAGNASPVISIFIPKRNSDDIRHNIIDYKAANSTLDQRGNPSSPEGIEAKASMETVKQTAEGKINSLLKECFNGAIVFQGGGSEIGGNNLQDMVFEAAENSLQRLYPQFIMADNTNWGSVYTKAKQGAPDALKALGYDGETVNHPVCKAIMSALTGTKKGNDIKLKFANSPYGWSGDAIDGAIQVLLTSGLILAFDEHNKPIVPTNMDRSKIGKSSLKPELTTVTTQQKLQIRKLFQKLLKSVNSGEELEKSELFLSSLSDLAATAGGESPRPNKPNTVFLEEIKSFSGNEKLIAIFNKLDDLTTAIDSWTKSAELIKSRIGEWDDLKELSPHIKGLKDSDIYIAQIEEIEKQRLLLQDPFPVTQLLKTVSQMLREELKNLDALYDKKHEEGLAKLDKDSNWQKLKKEEKSDIISSQMLNATAKPEVKLATAREILNTLKVTSISGLKDKIAAIPGRFDKAAIAAAIYLEPKAKVGNLPSRTLKTSKDVEEWIEETRNILLEDIKTGPIIL